MAGFYCAPCRLNFHFKSRYERHLKTLSHQRYALCVTGEDEPSAALFDQELAISSDAELIQDSTASTTLQLSSDASGSEQPDIDGSNDAANVPVTNPDRSEEELEADTSIVPTLDANLYKPFGSKLLAMAYLIVHSPRPMGHKNLKFILHTLRVACPSLPSLSLLVKYRLHGYYAPKMHFTRTGIPFYINPVSNTLKMCLGNPEISHNLVRYPVIPKGEFKEVFHGLHWRTDRRFFSPM
ncbi:hypothetical protein EMCRGX_G018263, partial [Ephydatia muelleri]